MALPDPTTTKIVFVEDQRFFVPRDAREEDIRSALAPTFPSIANARAETSTKTENELTFETVTFTKVAGTKGSAAFADRLAAVPPEAPVEDHRFDVAMLLHGKVTIAEALAANLPALLANVEHTYGEYTRLCGRLEQPPAIPIAVDDLI